MSSIIAEYINKIAPSITLSLVAKAKELRSKGVDVLGLSVGESDFDTPDHIKEAAIEAIKLGKTKYTPVDGLPELKDAVINKLSKENSLSFSKDEVMISAGAKQAIFNCMLATLNEGDEVIIPSPYWVSYPDIVKIARGKPVVLETKEENNFKFGPEELRKKITPKTKWLILNAPSNPTGQVYSKQELENIADILIQNAHVNVLSDDIYEHLIYKKFYTILNVEPRLKNRVMIVNGVSKSYAMTGWRIGYAAGDKEIISKMKVVQSQSTSNPCSISQYASVAALEGDQSFIQRSVKIFESRRNLACELFNESSALSVKVPDGAFYLFVNCKKLIGSKTKNGDLIKDDNDLCNYILEKGSVAVVPGSAFGALGYFRFSYAVADDIIREAIKRIKEVCDLLAY